MSDAAQIEKAVKEYQSEKNRDENSHVIYRYLYPRIFNIFRMQGVFHEECQDLTQEVIFRVFTHMREFRHDSRLDTWATRIAQHVFHDQGRRLRTGKRFARHISLDSGGDDGDEQQFEIADCSLESQPEEMALKEERERIVLEAVIGLPPRMRDCWRLRYEQERTTREIAVIMRISEGAVKAHLHQTEEKIRAYFISTYGESSI